MEEFWTSVLALDTEGKGGWEGDENLILEISTEWADIERVTEKAEQGWQNFQSSNRALLIWDHFLSTEVSLQWKHSVHLHKIHIILFIKYLTAIFRVHGTAMKTISSHKELTIKLERECYIHETPKRHLGGIEIKCQSLAQIGFSRSKCWDIGNLYQLKEGEGRRIEQRSNCNFCRSIFCRPLQVELKLKPDNTVVHPAGSTEAHKGHRSCPALGRNGKSSYPCLDQSLDVDKSEKGVASIKMALRICSGSSGAKNWRLCWWPSRCWATAHPGKRLLVV